MILVPPTEKTCRQCRTSKPLEEYHRNGAAADGRQWTCKACLRENYLRRRAGRPTLRRQWLDDVPAGHKRCRDCGEVKALADFPRNRRSGDGRHVHCKPCHNARGRESKQRLYGGTRQYHLKRRYGITADEAAAMLADQGGVCAICRIDLDVTTMHVDHDHTTGRVRGALCFSCNGGLGQFGDNVHTLLAAVTYLEGHAWEFIEADWDDSPLSSPDREAPPSPTS